MTAQNILIKGGAGFIGSHVVDRLAREGYKVRVLDNLSTGKGMINDSGGDADIGRAKKPIV